MKRNISKIFSRPKLIYNRQHQKIDTLAKISLDEISENLSIIRKDFQGNVAFFGQKLDYFLDSAPANFRPRRIFLCDIHPDLITRTLAQLNGEKVDIQNLDNYDDHTLNENKLTVTPICCEEELWPFQAESLQMIISNLHLHWVNEVQVALSRMQVSLEPDGLLLGTIFGQNTLQELRISYTLAENERYQGISSHVSPFISITEMGNLITRLQYTMPTLFSNKFQLEFESIFHLLQFLQDSGENDALIQTRQGTFKDTLYAMSAVYETIFKENEKAFASFEFINFAGWKYHESQQKPKQRGTAEFSLKSLVKDVEEAEPNKKLEYGEVEEEGDDLPDQDENEKKDKK